MLSELGPFLFEKSRLVQQLLSWTSFARPSVMSLAFPQDGLSAFGIPRHLLWTPETGPGRGSSGVAGCVHLWMAEFLKYLVQWLPIHTLLGLHRHLTCLGKEEESVAFPTLKAPVLCPQV